MVNRTPHHPTVKSEAWRALSALGQAKVVSQYKDIPEAYRDIFADYVDKMEHDRDNWEAHAQALGDALYDISQPWKNPDHNKMPLDLYRKITDARDSIKDEVKMRKAGQPVASSTDESAVSTILEDCAPGTYKPLSYEL